MDYGGPASPMQGIVYGAERAGVWRNIILNANVLLCSVAGALGFDMRY